MSGGNSFKIREFPLVAASAAAFGSMICRTAIVSAGLTPMIVRITATRSASGVRCRKVPRPTSRRTVPSARILSMAARTVLRATPYSSARRRSSGKRRLSLHSPASIRRRSDTSTSLDTRLGTIPPRIKPLLHHLAYRRDDAKRGIWNERVTIPELYAPVDVNAAGACNLNQFDLYWIKIGRQRQ